jgi:transposase
MTQCSKAEKQLTAGFDLGDSYSYLYVVDTTTGEMIEETRLPTNPETFHRYFADREAMHVAVETGKHSPWVSRLLAACGHEVLVANARKLSFIYRNERKSDRSDAENLARVARLDPKLLAPIEHRNETAQADLALVRSRDTLVKTRTQLINHVRGVVKSFGGCLPRCSSASFHHKVLNHLPEPLRPALAPMLETLAELSQQIESCNETIQRLVEERYPETQTLRQISGVGALTALTFMLTLESPDRFKNGRQVGAYLGLTPALHQSGDANPRRRISKAGDELLRHLLVECAHFIVRPSSPDSDLKRHGEKLMQRGGAYARNQAVVAVARKLAVLLQHLWLTGGVYEPLHNSCTGDHRQLAKA